MNRCRTKSTQASSTCNLDTTIIVNHAKCIVQKAEYFGKPVLRGTLHLLLR